MTVYVLMMVNKRQHVWDSSNNIGLYFIRKFRLFLPASQLWGKTTQTKSISVFIFIFSDSLTLTRARLLHPTLQFVPSLWNWILSITSTFLSRAPSWFQLTTPVLLVLLQMKYNRQSAPYWHVSLTNLCRLVAGLQQEAWSGEEKEEEVSELREGSLQLLGEVYSLQHFCRALQSREERVRGTQGCTHSSKRRQFFRDLHKEIAFCHLFFP